MINVHLYGHLKDSFGATRRLEVESAGEAVRALCVTEGDFERAVSKGAYVLIRQRTRTGKPFTPTQLSKALREHDTHIDLELLSFGLGESDLHLVPVVGGEGGKGIGKVIMGIALVAGAWAFAPAFLGAGFAAPGVLGGHFMGGAAFSMLGMSVSYGQIAFMGALMALGGVSQMLTKPPKAPEPTDKHESYIFSGPSNVGSQGNCVPLVYGGPLRVGSVTISSAISTESNRWGGTLATGPFGDFMDRDNDGYIDGTTYNDTMIGGGGGWGGTNVSSANLGGPIPRNPIFPTNSF